VRAQPQIQFGFQPVQQARPQQQQGSPFTAFAGGVPQQLRGVPQQQFRPQPQTAFGRPPPPQTQFRPGQPQQQFRPGQPQQLGVPPQLQQGARFTPQARPPPQQQQSSPFTVFNPAQFRG
jgi:hypothetical protein